VDRVIVVISSGRVGNCQASPRKTRPNVRPSESGGSPRGRLAPWHQRRLPRSTACASR